MNCCEESFALECTDFERCDRDWFKFEEDEARLVLNWCRESLFALETERFECCDRKRSPFAEDNERLDFTDGESARSLRGWKLSDCRACCLVAKDSTFRLTIAFDCLPLCSLPLFHSRVKFCSVRPGSGPGITLGARERGFRISPGRLRAKFGASRFERRQAWRSPSTLRPSKFGRDGFTTAAKRRPASFAPLGPRKFLLKAVAL